MKMEFKLLGCILIVCFFQGIRCDTMDQLIYRMRQVKDVAVFLDSMVRDENGEKVNYEEQERQFTESGEGVLASGDPVPLALLDFCQVRNMTYKFPRDSNANIIYFPECIQIERCGGCCGGELLTCQPTRSETLYFKALAVKYSHVGANTFEYLGFKKFAVERHFSCTPACAVQETDCHPLKHTYNPNTCGCECRPAYVTPCSTNKRFDSTTCECVCKEQKTCGSQSVFNTNSCQCQSGLFASGQEGPDGTSRRTTTTEADPCATTQCPDTWRAEVQPNGHCNCLPTFRFVVGRK